MPSRSSAGRYGGDDSISELVDVKKADDWESDIEVGDEYRPRSDVEDAELAIRQIERVVEGVSTGETFYYLVHESANPETQFVPEDRLAARDERIA